MRYVLVFLLITVAVGSRAQSLKPVFVKADSGRALFAGRVPGHTGWEAVYFTVDEQRRYVERARAEVNDGVVVDVAGEARLVVRTVEGEAWWEVRTPDGKHRLSDEVGEALGLLVALHGPPAVRLFPGGDRITMAAYDAAGALRVEALDYRTGKRERLGVGGVPYGFDADRLFYLQLDDANRRTLFYAEPPYAEGREIGPVGRSSKLRVLGGGRFVVTPPQEGYPREFSDALLVDVAASDTVRVARPYQNVFVDPATDGVVLLSGIMAQRFGWDELLAEYRAGRTSYDEAHGPFAYRGDEARSEPVFNVGAFAAGRALEMLRLAGQAPPEAAALVLLRAATVAGDTLASRFPRKAPPRLLRAQWLRTSYGLKLDASVLPRVSIEVEGDALRVVLTVRSQSGAAGVPPGLAGVEENVGDEAGTTRYTFRLDAATDPARVASAWVDLAPARSAPDDHGVILDFDAGGAYPAPPPPPPPPPPRDG
jgi:hypothetical protein